MRYHIFLDQDYYIPQEHEERFLFLTNKLIRLSKSPEYQETYIGYKKVFDQEFNLYKVSFKKGSYWEKKTESWQGNDSKGTIIRIYKIRNGVIWYGKGFFSRKYCLNKWSFLRIFAEV